MIITMLLHKNAWPHVARICSQFLKAENIPVFAWPAQSTDRSPTEHDNTFKFLPIYHNFTQPLKRSGPTFHRTQPTTWATQCKGDALHCERQKLFTPDTFLNPPKFSQNFKTANLRVASPRYNGGIFIVSIRILICHIWLVDGLSQQSRSAHQHKKDQIVS